LDNTRCHNCGIFKKDTNGLYISWLVSVNGTDKKLLSISWFHDKDCLDTWHTGKSLDYKIIDHDGRTGIKPIVPISEHLENEFSDKNDEL